MAEYQSPDQQPGTERRLLLIFAATFIIILLAQPLMKRFMPPPAPSKQSQTSQQPNAGTTPATETKATPSNVPPPTGSKQAAGETETVVENDLYRIVFTNRGAQVKSWVLKKYSDDAGKPQELVNEAAS